MNETVRSTLVALLTLSGCDAPETLWPCGFGPCPEPADETGQEPDPIETTPYDPCWSIGEGLDPPRDLVPIWAGNGADAWDGTPTSIMYWEPDVVGYSWKWGVVGVVGDPAVLDPDEEATFSAGTPDVGGLASVWIYPWTVTTGGFASLEWDGGSDDGTGGAYWMSTKPVGSGLLSWAGIHVDDLQLGLEWDLANGDAFRGRVTDGESVLACMGAACDQTLWGIPPRGFVPSMGWCGEVAGLDEG